MVYVLCCYCTGLCCENTFWKMNLFDNFAQNKNSCVLLPCISREWLLSVENEQLGRISLADKCVVMLRYVTCVVYTVSGKYLLWQKRFRWWKLEWILFNKLFQKENTISFLVSFSCSVIEEVPTYILHTYLFIRFYNAHLTN